MVDSGNEEYVEEEVVEEPESIGDTIREAMADLDMTNEDLGFSELDEALVPDEKISDQNDSDSNEPETPEVEDEVLVAPRSWSTEEKEAFKDFPVEAKKALIRRQADMDRNFHSSKSEMAAREANVNDIEQHLAPFKDEMARDGVTPQVLAQMYKWHKYLSDPKTRDNGIKELSSRYGANPASIPTSAVSNQNSNPAVQQVQSQVQDLQKTIQDQQNEAKQRQEQEYAQNVAAEVSAFRNDVDDNGAKKFPHIEEGGVLEGPVAEELKVLQQVNPTLPLREKLETAYKRALAMNPDIASEIAAKTSRQEQADKQAKVKKARIAGSSVTGSPTATPDTSAPQRSLRDELLANYKSMSS